MKKVFVCHSLKNKSYIEILKEKSDYVSIIRKLYDDNIDVHFPDFAFDNSLHGLSKVINNILDMDVIVFPKKSLCTNFWQALYYIIELCSDKEIKVIDGLGD